MATNKAQGTFLSYDARLCQLPEGAPLPETVDAVLPAGTIDYLWLSEDGETVSQTITRDVVRAHQKRTKIRRVTSDEDFSIAATLLSDIKAVRELYHMAKESASGKIVINGGDADGYVGNFVYDATDSESIGGGKRIRYAGTFDVTPNGDVTQSATGINMYPVLLTAVGEVYRLTDVSDEEAAE